jgi:hypothetical protein
MNGCGHFIQNAKLTKYIAAKADRLGRSLLVQPRLSNHPDFPIKDKDALLPVRIVTGRYPSGSISVIFATLYYNGYTNRALVDLETGQLCDIHSVENRTLPDWSAALALAKAAHNHCTDYVFVGWDVALTPEGPMLLEGNRHWATGDFQLLARKPLGHTEFSDILMQHFLSRDDIRNL